MVGIAVFVVISDEIGGGGGILVVDNFLGVGRFGGEDGGDAGWGLLDNTTVAC